MLRQAWEDAKAAAPWQVEEIRREGLAWAVGSYATHMCLRFLRGVYDAFELEFGENKGATMTQVRNRTRSERGSITPCQNTSSSEQRCGDDISKIGVVFCKSSQNTSAVSPVSVDGGTRFVIHLSDIFSPVPKWKAALLALETGALKQSIELPVSDALAPLEAAPVADVVVSGAKRHILTFLVPDLAWFRFNTESRDLHLQLKAKGLWAHGAGATGYVLMAGYWLRELFRLFCGEFRDDVFRAGWKMTGLELCRDFVGVKFYRNDAGHFVGAKTNGDEGRELVRCWGAEDQEVETINIGRRTSNLSLCIYDKLTQIDDVERITRVELRLSNRGLSWEDKESGEILDFSDPSTAAFQHNLDSLWQLACHKRRLVVPNTATRRERCDTEESHEVGRGRDVGRVEANKAGAKRHAPRAPRKRQARRPASSGPLWRAARRDLRAGRQARAMPRVGDRHASGIFGRGDRRISGQVPQAVGSFASSGNSHRPRGVGGTGGRSLEARGA